jgi:hypothetical protein
MEMVLSLMIQIAINYKTVAFDVPGTTKPPRMSPVEIWFFGYIVYLRMGISPMVALARHVGKLRKDVRAKFRDVFSNNATVSFMYHWLDKLAIEKPGPNQQVAAIEWENEDLPVSAGIGKKRKAVDRDDDYREPAPAKNRRTETTANRPAAPPPPPPASRPPPSSMDAIPQHGGISPYAISNPSDPRVQVCTSLYWTLIL